MQCNLTIRGKSYPSADFTERQVSGFLAATIGSTGMNIGSVFQNAFTDAGAAGEVLKQYDSAESAERDLAYWSKKLIPTLDVAIDSLDTTELIAIATALTEELTASPPSSTPPIVTQTPPGPCGFEALQARVEAKKDVSEKEGIAPDDLNYPPDRLPLTEAEIRAIGYASREMSHPYTLVECWYQWWKAIDEIEGEPVHPQDAIELIFEESGNPFTEPDSIRYYTLTQAHLQLSAEEAIAA